jgi:hypothetical protein
LEEDITLHPVKEELVLLTLYSIPSNCFRESRVRLLYVSTLFAQLGFPQRYIHQSEPLFVDAYS